MSIAAVVGGQYGSEGKGLIVGEIAKDYNVHVRVGAANAGHTVYTDTEIDPLNPKGLLHGWEKHVLQQIPCAAYTNPNATLIIGPGALISPEILAREVDANQAWRSERGLPSLRLIVDQLAHVITADHIKRERESDLAERIGSTSTIAREGIGAAQAARVMREAECVQVSSRAGAAAISENRDGPASRLADITFGDTSALLELWHRRGARILLEGTQGAGLSLTTGQFPYVTSRNTTAAGLCADAGVSPRALERVILVCRTYPIRVAGPSGPFWPDSQEITWGALGIDPETERTTVTKKVRRVATFSYEQVKEAAWLNGATEIALTFCDYIAPHLSRHTGVELHAPVGAAEMVRLVKASSRTPVTMLGTGPHSVIHIQPNI